MCLCSREGEGGEATSPEGDALHHEIWKYYQSTSKAPANAPQNIVVPCRIKRVALKTVYVCDMTFKVCALLKQECFITCPEVHAETC